MFSMHRTVGHDHPLWCVPELFLWELSMFKMQANHLVHSGTWDIITMSLASNSSLRSTASCEPGLWLVRRCCWTFAHTVCYLRWPAYDSFSLWRLAKNASIMSSCTLFCDSDYILPKPWLHVFQAKLTVRCKHRHAKHLLCSHMT